jgi:hypothetical protein
MRSDLVRPVIAKCRHPLGPKVLVVEVGSELMTKFKHGDMRMQATKPFRPEWARSCVSLGRTVDENHQPLTASCRNVNHVRVAQMRRVKAAHNQAGAEVLLTHLSTGRMAVKARKAGDHSMPSDAKIAIRDAVLAGRHVGKQGRAGVCDQPDGHLVTRVVGQLLCSNEPMFRCHYRATADFGTGRAEVGKHTIEIRRAAIDQHCLGIGEWLHVVTKHRGRNRSDGMTVR